MKAFQSLKYKTRIGLLLGILLICLLGNNILGQKSFERIGQDARSIYEDRLMPSTYLFDLQDHLYHERTLMQAAAIDGAALSRIRAAISAIVAKYEKTRLTREERSEWLHFKTNLQRLHSPKTAAAGPAFDLAIHNLMQLNAIQAGVAKDLETRMTDAATASSIRGYLEFALLIVVGAVTLSLIGYSRDVFQTTVSHRPSMN